MINFNTATNILNRTFVAEELLGQLCDQLKAERRENAILRFQHKMMMEGYRPGHMNDIPHMNPL